MTSTVEVIAALENIILSYTIACFIIINYYFSFIVSLPSIADMLASFLSAVMAYILKCSFQYIGNIYVMCRSNGIIYHKIVVGVWMTLKKGDTAVAKDSCLLSPSSTAAAAVSYCACW